MQNIIIWGMGNYYKNRKSWMANDYNVIAFIHSDPAFCGKIFEEKKVILPVQIKEYDYDFILVAVEKEEKCIKQLMDLNVPRNKIKKLSFSSDMVYNGQNQLEINRNKINLFYCDYPNIGDILNAFMIDKLFKVEVVKAKIQDADMLAIGSILDLLLIDDKNLIKLEESDIKTSKIHIWGTGFMYENKYHISKKLLRPIEVHALRGKLSKDILSKIFNYEGKCVFGDPGLLASLLYSSKEKKYEIGIIPHYIENCEKIFLDMQKYYKNAVVIDVRDYPIRVLKKISQCKCVISTSLHGLIIADSYGIPNQWCVYSNKILGNSFKYYDYYSSFDLEKNPYILKDTNFPDIDKIVKNYSIELKDVKKKQKELITSFPEK